MRETRTSFVVALSLTGQFVLFFYHGQRLGLDHQLPRSDYPLLGAIFEWYSVCLPWDGKPTSKLPGKRRAVSNWASMIPRGRASYPPAALANPGTPTPLPHLSRVATVWLWCEHRWFNFRCIGTDRSQAIKRVLSPSRRGRKTFRRRTSDEEPAGAHDGDPGLMLI